MRVVSYLILLGYCMTSIGLFGCGGNYQQDIPESATENRRESPPPSPLYGNGLNRFFDDYVAKLKFGKFAMAYSEKMKVGKKERIEVRLSRSDQADLQHGLDKSGKIVWEELVKVGPEMRVELSGDAFDIQKPQEEDRFVPVSQFTSWIWYVTPLNAGEHFLDLDVIVRIRLPNGKRESTTRSVLSKKIKISVNPLYTAGLFFKEHWRWLLTTLVIPLIVYFYKARKKKKKKK